MHAILTSIGTDGDILPMIGLGVALKARGHRVTMVVAENYADLVAAHWLEFRQLVSAAQMHALLSNPDFWHPVKTARFTANWGAPFTEPTYHLFKELAAEGDAVFIANPAIFGAMLASETERRPLATVVLQPWMIPSADAPPVMPIIGMPLAAPRFVHSYFFRLISFIADQLYGRELNRVRKRVGLRPIRNVLYNWFSRDLVLGMFPNWYGPQQSDWPRQIRLTGFPRFEASVRRGLPAGLPEFLGAEPAAPTIAFTFGTGMMHAPQIFDAATRACAKIGVRGLFINRYQTPNPPAHMFHTNYAPFSEVFPRCAAVVHHGGIGTVAEAFAAGVPQLTLPLGFDQLDNAIRVRRCGAGLHLGSQHRLVTRKTPFSEREVNQLAATLKTLLEPKFRRQCAEYRDRVLKEDAISIGAEEVERLAKR